MKFLARLAENSDHNKMTAANLAIVIGPSLLWPAPSSLNDNILVNSGLVLSSTRWISTTALWLLCSLFFSAVLRFRAVEAENLIE